jgi:WS/DGAT/MGAT family acyltransferase
MPNPINRQLFMQQLSGLDAAFVHQDTRRTPMHVTAVLIYDVGSVSGSSVQRADLHRLLAGNLNRFALFRRRLQRVPLDLDTPYWVDVRNPDWDQHLAEISCDPAGDWQGFQHLLTGLHNRGLDLSRPLWEMCLVHGVNDLPGLPPRCQALVLKFHHSVIDGMSLAAIVDTMHQDEMPASGDDAKDRPAPRYSDMWTRFSINTMDRQIKFAETMSKLMPGVLRASLKQDRFSDLPAVLATRAHFNNAVGTAKTTGFVLWPREEFLVIRRAVRRVTLNDIALSIVSGALREYLKSHAQLPAKSLACGVPINQGRSGHFHRRPGRTPALCASICRGGQEADRRPGHRDDHGHQRQRESEHPGRGHQGHGAGQQDCRRARAISYHGVQRPGADSAHAPW